MQSDLTQLVSLVLRPSERVTCACEVWSVRGETGEKKRRIAAVAVNAEDEAVLLVLRRNGTDSLETRTALALVADVSLALAQHQQSGALTLSVSLGKEVALRLFVPLLADIEPLLKDLRLRINAAVSVNPFILDDFSLNPLNSRIIKENWIAKQLRAREAEFAAFRDLKLSRLIFTGTWNVNGQDPTEPLHMWLHEDADIYVLGFQELDLSTEIYMFSDNTKHDRWSGEIERFLGSLKTKFYKVASKQLIGLLVLVYAKESLKPEINEVSTDAVGTGLMGFGNKGAVSCRFRLHDSYLCFVNAHLAADTSQTERRNQDFAEICKRTRYSLGTQSYVDLRDYLRHNPWVYSPVDLMATSAVTAASSPGVGAGVGIYDSDHLFFMGDLNYRVPLSDTAAKLMLTENQLEKLFAHDQLTIEKRYQRVLKGFQEPEITFQPTYKFDIGTHEYDTSEKKRSPSWCDRILWFANPLHVEAGAGGEGEGVVATLGKEKWIENLWYRSSMVMKMSDHKPVSALFRVKIRQLHHEKLDAVTEALIKELDKLENDALPRLEVEEDTVSFGDVTYLNASTQCIHVKNTGKVVAHFRFLAKGKEQLAAKPFYFMSPQTGTLFPGDVMKLHLTLLVRDVHLCARLNFGVDTLDDLFILHTDLGKDTFVSATGRWSVSSFGLGLEVLCGVKGGAVREVEGGVEGVKVLEGEVKGGKGREGVDVVKVGGGGVKEMIGRPEENGAIPKELWRLVDFIYRFGMDVDCLFKTPGDAGLVQYIVECLDTGAEFDVEGLLLDFVDESAELAAIVNPDSASQDELADSSIVTGSVPSADEPKDTTIALDIDLLLKSTTNAQGPSSPAKHGKILKLARRKGRVAAVHAMAECLLRFLDGLVVPVITPDVYMWCITEGYLDRKVAQQILAALPLVHGHVFVYLVSFLKETLEAYSGLPEMNVESIARVFAPLVVKKPVAADVSFLKEVGGFGVEMRATMFMMQFLKEGGL
ncbi:hypothetical protein HDU98_005989 [Podochytrium sp. JEL0797]|nr:hypothetical protein HDU98_005989 [Podochytrium sp. JEL0797]